MESFCNTNKAMMLDIPKILDDRGNLSFVEKGIPLSFNIRRTYWIYDVPGGEIRGGHAFKTQEEIIIALSGSFDVILNNGQEDTRYSLNRSYQGLYIPKMVWRRMENFSTNAVCMVLASTFYNEDDYIHDFEIFEKMQKKR